MEETMERTCGWGGDDNAPIPKDDEDKPLADDVDGEYVKGNDKDKDANGKDKDEYARGNNDHKLADGDEDHEYARGNDNKECAEGRGSTRENAIFSSYPWTNSE
jgi:hypothetical protein